MQRLTPTPEQAEAIQRMAEDMSGGALVGAEIGSGKTLISSESTLQRYARRVLVIAPIPVYENWRDTFAAQTDGSVKLKACGKTKYAGIPAKELKDNLAEFYAGEDGYYFMGREFWISQDWHTVEGKRRQKHIYKKHPVDVLIFDEAHFACNPKSRGFKTFLHAAADYKMAVTGTFFGNDFDNAYSLPRVLWGQEFTDTHALWRAEYARTEYNNFTYNKISVTGEAIPGRWVSELPTYIFLEGHKGEVLTEAHHVDLYPSQRRVYDGLDKEYAARANSGQWLLPELRATAHIRMRQACIADIDVEYDEPYTDPDTGKLVSRERVFFPESGKSAKYDELLRLLKDHDEQVVVSMDFVGAADAFVKWLNRDGISAGLWAGKQHTSDDERMALKADFLAGRTRVIVGIPAAMGTGVDLLQTVARRLYIISETQNGIEREQLIGRLNRRGQEKPVYVVNIHGRNTVDVDITSSLAMKALDNAEARYYSGKN